jgi:hypothetical protein
MDSFDGMSSFSARNADASFPATTPDFIDGMFEEDSEQTLPKYTYIRAPASAKFKAIEKYKYLVVLRALFAASAALLVVIYIHGDFFLR